MLPTFDSTLKARPLRQHGTLQHFFEIFLLLARDLDPLAEIENLLRHLGKDSAVNSLHNKKTRKEMRMNIHIGDYEFDLMILDLGLDVNILTKQTWEKMGKLTLGCSSVQL